MSEKLQSTLTTSLTLLEQFQGAIASPSSDISSSTDLSGKDALPLLSAASTTLKSQVTKLSLLTITSPFTPSAVTSVINALNESVLPSLVAAALLVTPAHHTKAFQSEVHVLTQTALKETTALLQEVQTVAKKAEDAQKKEAGLSQSEKDVVTVAAGRLWDSCDVLIDIAAKGVVGFVVRRVEEWRDLIYPTISANRLKKTSDSPSLVGKLESLMKYLQQIPGHVDEVAGALYEANTEKSLQYMRITKDCAVKAVNLASLPLDVTDSADAPQEKEDKFTTWARTWLKVMDQVSKSVIDATQ
ncbi:reactive intermediate/imine deaminase family protein [Aspergillus niger]|uniref:Reactive intermediate/imine deaminase family protein n=1 Tax=Aspergillus niger TaxID=5061 RepID=A0A505I4X4_ASPNG|nr:reactive intermediate/imine deaminase family protein [Aspergillus niger]